MALVGALAFAQLAAKSRMYSTAFAEIDACPRPVFDQRNLVLVQPAHRCQEGALAHMARRDVERNLPTATLQAARRGGQMLRSA